MDFGKVFVPRITCLKQNNPHQKRGKATGRSEKEDNQMDSMTNASLNAGFDGCVSSIVSRYIFTSWFLLYLLFLPVFLFVLYIGFKKWTTSQSSASGGLSHSDVFTLNMVVMEMTTITGSFVSLYGYYRVDTEAMKLGGTTVLSTMTGQMLFHSLTCVERYLAVVHPVTYLRLKREGWVTIRNISITFVWAFSLVYTLTVSNIHKEMIYAVSGFLLAIAPLPLVTYCSVYVLCVLTNPKPGEGGGHRKHIDQSKHSTVYTMVAILGALLIRLIVLVVNSCIHVLNLGRVDGCVTTVASLWAALPSSLVLPLLFLHRVGNLPRKATK